MKRCLLLTFFLVAMVAGPGASGSDARKTAALLAVVQSGGPVEERARALQQLALVATADAVPAAAALLDDARLGQYARDVLELMPEPAAGDALRAALARLRGNALIGVVNSLGVRREAASVAGLRRLADDPASPAAAPALLALGRIGTAEAAAAIEPALRRGPSGLRAAAAEAGLLVADRWIQEGRVAAALAWYDRLRDDDAPAPVKEAAVRGAILARGPAGLPLLLEQLRSADSGRRDLALLAMRELPGTEVTPAIVAELDRLPVMVQVPVLGALVDRADPEVLPAVEARARTGHQPVRVAALQSLGRIGRASSVPILLQSVKEQGSPETADAALASLARIPAPETDAALLEGLRGADRELQIKLIGVLGDRRAAGSTGELMRLAAGRDPDIAKAAFRALGVVAIPADLPRLIELAVGTDDEAVKVLADRSIVTTAMKIIEPRRRADALLAAFRGATDPGIRRTLVRPLGAVVRSMGGSHEVFSALRAALRDDSEEVRAAALACLAEWPDATPVTILLERVQRPDAPAAERELALRGAVRLATNVAAGRERSPLNVLEAFRQANAAVRTKEEKLMVVSGLGHLKHPAAAGMLRPYLDDAEVQAEAALAVVQVAPALGGGKGPAELKVMLERIAATERDETVRSKAARLAKGGPAAPAPPGKGKAAKAARPSPSAGTEPLFNGRDLGGWDGDPAVWRVRDGTIVGGSLEGNPRNEFLATTRRYRNFRLRLDYRLTGTEGFVNGGVQFRSVRIPQPPNEMSGYQADIGAGHSGCLYDESRRKRFLARAPDDVIRQVEKPGDWNTCEIRAEGPRIELTLNGRTMVSYTEADSGVAADGLIALQIHGNCKAEIEFRNLAMEELP